MSEKKRKNQRVNPTRWVDLYGDYLYAIAMIHVRDSSVAEELVQETFLSALQNKEQFEGRSSEKTWLTSILRHKIFDHFRRAKKAKENLDPGSINLPENIFDEKGHWNVQPKRWQMSPDELLEKKEFWHVLMQCLGEHSERFRTIFLLREMDNWDTGKICKAFGISPSNFWVIMYRTRMFLRQCLEKSWSDETQAL